MNLTIQINTAKDKELFISAIATSRAREKECDFRGRLGSYKYLDMHQAIGAALKVFENQLMRFRHIETGPLIA